MKRECAESFRHYREVARVVWNLGFCVKPDLREWDCVFAYREAMARLFEGMILIPLGVNKRVDNVLDLGGVARFSVVANSALVPVMIDRDLPGGGTHEWANPTPVGALPYELKFIEFFDWFDLDFRDLRLLRVEIERMDEKPEVVGRHALIELSECTVWVDIESGIESPSA